MGQSLIVTQRQRHLAGPFPSQLFQGLLVTGFTRAEQHQLTAPLQQCGNHLNQPVHAFLLHQAADKTEQGAAVHF